MERYIGRMLDGRYEILDIIGAGGMAVVYKARCHRLDRLVAIKILKDENLDDEDLCRRFQDESRAVAMLNHDNIVQVFDVSSIEDRDYIVMELIDGITLKQYMTERVRLNWRETVHFAINIAKALEHAHRRGLVHRDIKPHNVMVLKDGSVKVADFGIARLMENENSVTKEALGSVDYISPEQAKGGRVDNRSDLYSLGVVMYEMITGRTPYVGDTPVAVAIQHINGGAPRPSSIRPNIPRGLEQIILKAMACDLQDRYINAAAMLQDLEAFKHDPYITFSTMPQSPQMERRGDLHLHQPGGGTPPADEPAGSRHQVTWGPSRRDYPVDDGAEEEERSAKSNASTIAVVVCSLVAIMAIIIFMILLTQNDTNAHRQPTVPPTEQTVLVRPTPAVTLATLAQTVPQTTAAPTLHTVATTTAQAKMVNVVNLSRREAEQQLSQLGFCNITWVEQESNLPAGTVIGQSIAPDAVVAVNTPITLAIAAGAVTIDCTFDMPFRTESYTLTILLDGRPVVLDQRMEPYLATATFQLTGKGRQTCQLFVDGEHYYTVTVDFDAYAGK